VAETRPRQRSEENTTPEETPKETSETPDLTKPETEIVSEIPPEFLRPPRKVDIPPITPIRVIKETYLQDESLEVKQTIEVAKIAEISVLTPPQEIQIPPLPNPVGNEDLPNNSQAVKKSSHKGIIVFLSLIFILTILLGGLSLYLWQSSKQILSPIP